MSNANPGRDILSSEDIAATCGDGECPTCDAAMTPADEAALAQVYADIPADRAPVALTIEAAAALPAGARVVRLSTGKAYVKCVFLSYPGQVFFRAERNGEAFGRLYGFHAGRFGLPT